MAGAIISGAYFGDKMSPLSDTTNLASGVTETDLFEHIRHMFYTTIPGLVIALSFYFFAGMQFSAHNIQDGNIQTMISTLEKHFVISPWLLLVPMLVIFLVAKKVPALPALAVGVLSGFICQVFVQGDPAGDAIRAMHDGYTIESGQAWVDELFNRGGIESMMYTVSLTIVAMTFGGIMESTGMQKALVNQILKLAKSAKSLIPTTILSSFVTNVTAAEQYISILLPSRMFASAYKKETFIPKTCPVRWKTGARSHPPWNTCGVFITSTLGVNTFQYAPYAIFNYTVPVIGILLAVLGVKVAGLNRKEE
ncbi:Na+/H+ antiporter NhaC family protein [Thermoactinomyces vulgaris]|uniref:Na+/H+ antiporter NhaC family protein n=2 Tax=Thermoactinomyces TaxID=2023 RepID=UPI0036D9DF9A